MLSVSPEYACSDNVIVATDENNHSILDMRHTGHRYCTHPYERSYTNQVRVTQKNFVFKIILRSQEPKQHYTASTAMQLHEYCKDKRPDLIATEH